MGRVTAALFLDFDNIFSGLLTLDRNAALVLAEQPVRFLNGLRDFGKAAAQHRDLLVRRAYLNPEGSVPDPEGGEDAERVPFSRYRLNLVRAGFEVIDCPPLTSNQKNAADIRMVIDVLDALHSPAHYDEIIIASSDADFTPLLLRLRAADRRTMIIAAGTMSAAYRSVADRVLDPRRLAAMIGPDVQARSPQPAAPAVPVSRKPVTKTPPPPPVRVQANGDSAKRAKATSDAAAAEKRCRTLLRKALADAQGPVHLGQLGAGLRKETDADVITTTKWFGYKSLSAFVSDVYPKYEVGGAFAWDPKRHKAPPS